MGWFIKLESHGKNLYPKLREVFEKPEYYANEKVRGEMFRHFGYFMTESSGHLSEYLPISAGAGKRWIPIATNLFSAENQEPRTIGT